MPSQLKHVNQNQTPNYSAVTSEDQTIDRNIDTNTVIKSGETHWCVFFFSLLLRQLPALSDREHAAGWYRDDRRRPAALVSRPAFWPIVLQFPRRHGLRGGESSQLDPWAAQSEWKVGSALFSLRLGVMWAIKKWIINRLLVEGSGVFASSRCC